MPAASDSGICLAELLTKVVELGGDGLEIEYKDGYDEITCKKASLGFGLGDIKSDSPEASALRNELWSLRNRGKRVEVHGRAYKVRVTTFDRPWV